MASIAKANDEIAAHSGEIVKLEKVLAELEVENRKELAIRDDITDQEKLLRTCQSKLKRLQKEIEF
jgi:hypothetical protein